MDLPPHRSWSLGGTRPVLALHCSLAHAGAWSGLALHLSGVTLTATDQPGHGRAAPWQPGTDLHGLATRQSIAMAEHLGAPLDLIGHSFGGTVALRLMLERPDLVRSLTLIEPVIFAAARAAGDPAFAPFLAGHRAFADLIRAGRRVEAAAGFHAAWGAGQALADLPERARRYMVDRIHLIEAQNPVLVDDAAGLLRAYGLESIGVPVLLVEGAASPPVIAAIQGELARRLPQVTRLSVPGAGHMVPITHPEPVAAAVMALLARS
jgi:lipase